MRIINSVIFLSIFIITSCLKAEGYLLGNFSAWTKWGDIGTNNELGNVAHLRWSSMPIQWYLNSNGAGDGINFSNTLTEVTAAFSNWANINTASISFNYSGQTGLGYGVDQYNVVHWAEDGDAAYETGNIFDEDSTFLETLLGRTAITVDANNNIINSDIILNGKFIAWTIDINSTSEPVDIQAVVTHEIGHLLGIGHTDVTPQDVNYQYNDLPVMFYAYVGGVHGRNLKLDDKVAASFLYGGRIITDYTLTSNPNLNFLWNITIDQGASLTFSFGQTVRFNPNISLTVNGDLTANGTAIYKITFTEKLAGQNGAVSNSTVAVQVI